MPEQSWIITTAVGTGEKGYAGDGGPAARALLNGPFDADKLDYMPRDSAMAGIPCAVDVKRIIEKVHAVSVPSARLPRDYAAWAPPMDGQITTLVLSAPGSRALHELAVTKNFLFDKVKTRSIHVDSRYMLWNMAEVDGAANLLAEMGFK